MIDPRVSPGTPAWHRTDDVEVYAAATTPFLEAEPCSRNVLRWIIELARTGRGGWSAAPSFWWLTDGAVVAGAASWTPPFHVLVSAIPSDTAPQLVHALRAQMLIRGQPVTGVGGPRAAAAAVAAAWRPLGGGGAELHMAQRLHELTAVEPVRVPPGSRRRAAPGDLDLLVRWLQDFSVEVRLPSGESPRALMSALVQDGLCEVWAARGNIVSMAARRAPLAGVVRVGPVYTPPEHRGRGYARRLVAELSAAALKIPGVLRCMLYTDTANPVSNSIYRQIGYVAREEHLDFAFA